MFSCCLLASFYLVAQLVGYGKQRYSPGAMTTSKGFTGQYTDVLTELDYYNARYYDPKVGLFLSADTVQGNSAGMDPYAYVGNNPETLSDPTGQMYAPPQGAGGGGGGGSNNGGGHGGGGGYRKPPPQKDNSGGGFWGFVGNVATTVLDATTGIPSMINDVQTIFDGSKSWQDKLLAGGDLLLNAGMDALALTGVGELVDIGIRAGIHLAEHVGADLVEHAAADAVEHTVADTAEHIAADTTEHTVSSTADHTAADTMQHAACSFTFLTLVATNHGEQAIGTLQVGTKVLAYNPKTHTMEQEPVLHVWVHSDNDLIDLTISTTTKGQHGTPAHSTNEVVHTNQKHPFLTIEKGFLPVGQIVLVMHVWRADGQIGMITGWKVVPGAKTMYNLEVAQDHTFTVGDGQWVVHNCTDNPAIDSSQPYNRPLLGDTPSNRSSAIVIANEPVCHWCGTNASTVADHEPSVASRWKSAEYDNVTQAQARADADDPGRMVGSCRSCNSSKSGRVVGTGPGQWDPRTSPPNQARGGPSVLPWIW
ncbi:MAG: polymorphic toxin-type HINT domain-containing protein [Chloroflexota bacterium]|nr:polymorphic toxin-type HINT domain-containing protein [Chloroflexota bacterium]